MRRVTSTNSINMLERLLASGADQFEFLNDDDTISDCDDDESEMSYETLFGGDSDDASGYDDENRSTSPTVRRVSFAGSLTNNLSIRSRRSTASSNDSNSCSADLEDVKACVAHHLDVKEIMENTNYSPALLVMKDAAKEELAEGKAHGIGSSKKSGKPVIPQGFIVDLTSRMASSDSYFQAPDTATKKCRRHLEASNCPEAPAYHAPDKPMPPPDAAKSPNKGVNPQDYLQTLILDGIRPPEYSDQYWDDYFVPVTDQRVQRYTALVARAMRSADVGALQHIIDSHGDEALDACNAHGESLAHIACRRSSMALVELLQKGNVPFKVRDDFGKTVLHDVMWNRQPSLEVCMLVLEHAPELMVAEDKRGFTPLQYAPRETWTTWCDFLDTHKDWLRLTLQHLSFLQTRETLMANHEKLHAMIQRLGVQ